MHARAFASLRIQLNLSAGLGDEPVDLTVRASDSQIHVHT
jgi:hypothetical protein